METKICTTCGEVKELALFHNNKSHKDGKQSQCKECVREYKRKYRLENAEKERARARKWQLENPERARENKRKWYLENLEKAREKNRKWKLENLEKAREAVRKWRLENPEKGSEHVRKWKLENPEKAREIKSKSVRKSVRELKTGYVKGLLRKEFNIPASEITPLDVKEKREQLQYHRQIISLTKQLKQNDNKS